jgi:hypothetical protein
MKELSFYKTEKSLNESDASSEDESSSSSDEAFNNWLS